MAEGLPSGECAFVCSGAACCLRWRCVPALLAGPCVRRAGDATRAPDAPRRTAERWWRQQSREWTDSTGRAREMGYLRSIVIKNGGSTFAVDTWRVPGCGTQAYAPSGRDSCPPRATSAVLTAAELNLKRPPAAPATSPRPRRRRLLPYAHARRPPGGPLRRAFTPLPTTTCCPDARRTLTHANELTAHPPPLLRSPPAQTPGA